jgi:hypothetical protein
LAQQPKNNPKQPKNNPENNPETTQLFLGCYFENNPLFWVVSPKTTQNDKISFQLLFIIKSNNNNIVPHHLSFFHIF